MPKTNVKIPSHLDWLVDTGKTLKTACGRKVNVLELKHTNDTTILSAWAKHFRNQYCSDNKIDALKGKLSRQEYLENIKFPSKTTAPGPSIRAGDFAEILLADYLEWGLSFWVPRLRWDMKPTANDSAKGCDVIGFHFAETGKVSASDALAIIESKASLSGKNPNRLQDAVTDSAKDDVRKAESLNYLKQRFAEQGKSTEAGLVERFQSPVDQPYKELCAAAAVFSSNGYNETTIKTTNSSTHPHHDNLKMLVVKGDDLMKLVHDLYQRAADEA
jgi:hypothetical protein